MAKKKEPVQNDTNDTVLGHDRYEWKLILSGTSLDIRQCENCGFTSNFPKNMNDCIWTTCPECGKDMRW